MTTESAGASTPGDGSGEMPAGGSGEMLAAPPSAHAGASTPAGGSGEMLAGPPSAHAAHEVGGVAAESNPALLDGPTKAELRALVLEARRELGAADLAADARLTAALVLGLPEIAVARCVAAYVSIGSEPGTRHLIDVLAARGVLVLAPVLLADGDLDWAEYDGPGGLEPAARGLVEPVGPRLGVEAVRRADVVIVPALAVDERGNRLGRGGGSYDRVLGRVAPGALVCALLHEGELLARGATVPTEPHDRPVHAAATPSALHRLPAPPRT